jgi:hypothetical protein
MQFGSPGKLMLTPYGAPDKVRGFRFLPYRVVITTLSWVL